MKNRIFLYFLFSFLIIGSCKQQDLINEFNTSGRDLTLGEAKAFFENKVKPSRLRVEKQASTNSSSHEHDENCNHEAEMQPMWDGFKYRVLSGGNQAVMAPIHKKGAYIKVSEDRMVKFGFLNYLMMYKDSVGNIISERVLLKPSQKWLNSKYTRKYDGDIIVKDWDGKVKRIYQFVDGVGVKVSRKSGHSRKFEKQASINKVAAANDDVVCFVTTTYTLNPATCPCKGHTYAQIDQCTCHTKPTNTHGSITVQVQADCPPDDPEDLPVPTTGGEGGEPGSGGNNGWGGGSDPSDYPPLNCNPDPNYTVPTYPAPDGKDWMLPCSSTEFPYEPLPEEPLEEPDMPASVWLLNIFSYYGIELSAGAQLNDIQSQHLIDFISQREDNEDLVEMAYWGFNEVTSGNITWEQLYNGFLREYDEVQLDFDPTITVDPSWINNSSYFSYQNLPSLSSYKSNYPKSADGSYEMSSGSVYYLVGGDVLQMKIDAEKRGEGENYQNACALRVSLALLKSGINIPHIPGVTFKGKDINGVEAYFFLRAQRLYDWMMKEFYHGNRIDLTNADRGNANGDGFKNALNNKQGIYIFIPADPGYYRASGHAGIYTNPPLTKYYFEYQVKNIALWELH